MIKRSDIQIRDPFVLADNGMYYLYGTTDKNCWGDTAEGFDSYRSRDLENWEGPFAAFRPDADFWADKNFWAPEVFLYKGRYYMFATFKKEGVCRGTQILVSDRPDGRFVPHSEGALTPADWECLDGTLYIDKEAKPWMVFCHEWTQIGDGAMCAVRLSEDLRSTEGEAITLFHASEASWTRPAQQKVGGVMQDVYVTDGPFLYRTKTGRLLMFWSSGGEHGYAMGMAESSNGDIDGEWTHKDKLLFEKDGGHGMIFTGFDGRTYAVLHSPNRTPNERPCFFPVRDTGDGLELIV